MLFWRFSGPREDIRESRVVELEQAVLYEGSEICDCSAWLNWMIQIRASYILMVILIHRLETHMLYRSGPVR